MEIRQWTDRDDLRAALEVRQRTWQVGYRGVVDADLIDVVATEPDETAVDELAEAVENEAGALLVAVESPAEADADGEQGGDETSGDGTADAADAEADDAEGTRDVVGYVRVRFGSTDEFLGPLEAEVVDLYVDPAHWRNGIGTALLEAADEWTPATLESIAAEVLTANDRGRAFLEANDFESAGTDAREVAGEPHETVWYRAESGPA